MPSRRRGTSRRGFLAGGATGAALGLAPAGAADAPVAAGSALAPAYLKRTLRAGEAIDLAAAARDERWWPYPVDLAPAAWIWLPAERTLPNTFVLFRREFSLAATPTRAIALIAADSRYRLTVNGARVQWGPAPCDPRELDVDTADLTPFLKAGENVIGVEVLFFGHGDGTWAGGKPGLLFHLTADLPGGASERVVSDPAWLARVDRAHAPGQYKRWFLRALQEDFDARLHPYGWDRPGYRPDALWLKPATLDCPPNRPAASAAGRHWCADSVHRADPAVSSLRLRQIPAPREERVAARRLAHSGLVEWLRPPEDWFDMRLAGCMRCGRDPVAVAAGPGEWRLPAPSGSQGVQATFEFEEQIVGWPYFTIDAPEGAIVEMMVQENHDPAKTRWLDTHHFSWARFRCREGVNRFESFDYESLRWLQLHVRNASRPVRIREVGVRRMLHGWRAAPRVVCSEPPLQRLFDASLNTLRNSAVGTLVDGAGRERQQYSGDVGHQLHVARYAFGDAAVCRRFLRTYSEGSTHEGYFLDCWPAYDRLVRIAQRQVDASFWGPLLDHGIGFAFDCWNHYMETGERDALAEPYPRLKRFAAYLERIRAADGLLPISGLGAPTVWIDHHYNAPARQKYKQCAFNLYAAAMLRHALAPIAGVFGETADAARYRRLGDALLAASVRGFWSTRERAFVVNQPWIAAEKAPLLCDRALATAILFDQCPGGDNAAALDALVRCPKNMGFSYPANQVWRLWALARMNRADVVIQELRERWATLPSVVENATLQETFRVRKDSTDQWSHCPQAPLILLFQDLCGVRPTSPGFATFQARPQLGDLGALDLVMWTPRGPIRFVADAPAGAGRQVKMEVPKGCKGHLIGAGGERFALREGGATSFQVRADGRVAL
jgi:hypothetical protein